MIKKIILPTFLFVLACSLTACSLTACAVSKYTSQDQSTGTASRKTVIEMELTKDYDVTEPFVNARLFASSADLDVLEATATCQLDGESGILEIKEQETGLVLWEKSWDESIDHDTFTLSLNQVVKDKEYAIYFTGTKINSAKVTITFENSFIQERERPLHPTSEPLFNNQSGNFFHTLTITDQDPITAEFDVELDGGEATFLVIEVTEDMEATAHYTYTTYEQEGAAWGYYLYGSEAKTTFDLRSGTENVYLKFWTDESVALKQGRNIFYISGNDTSCKMHFEVSGLDHTKVSYVGMYLQEEALEMLKALEEVSPRKE